jgi:hypothetical protein
MSDRKYRYVRIVEKDVGNGRSRSIRTTIETEKKLPLFCPIPLLSPKDKKTLFFVAVEHNGELKAIPYVTRAINGFQVDIPTYKL